MAPTPKKKHSHERTAHRRGKIKLSLPGLVRCKSCSKLKFPHRECKNCGSKA